MSPLVYGHWVELLEDLHLVLLAVLVREGDDGGAVVGEGGGRPQGGDGGRRALEMASLVRRGKGRQLVVVVMGRIGARPGRNT